MFVVLLTGQGEGCDYTIGCNKTFKTLKAETWEEAEKEVAKICGEYSEPSIAKARILEVSQAKDFDITAWKEKRRKRREEKKAEEELASKKAQYEKLKAEFEPEFIPGLSDMPTDTKPKPKKPTADFSNPFTFFDN